MKGFLQSLALVLVVVSTLYLLPTNDVAAQGGGAGSPGNPIYTRRSQGNVRDQISISCNNNTAVVAASAMDNVLSMYCQNMETTATNRIGLCPRAAAVGACDATAKYAARLDGGEGWTSDVSVPGAWSCDGVGGTYTLNCYLERYVKPNLGGPVAAPSSPTPTPIATPTPTPT